MLWLYRMDVKNAWYIILGIDLFVVENGLNEGASDWLGGGLGWSIIRKCLYAPIYIFLSWRFAPQRHEARVVSMVFVFCVGSDQINEKHKERTDNSDGTNTMCKLGKPFENIL